MAGLICSVCGQLPESGQEVLAHVVSDSALVPRLDYKNLGTVESRVGLSSFEVPGQLIMQDIFSIGQAECSIMGLELPKLKASGTRV